jgi:serine/threonine protein kinase/tetratricopeptide (TPR) repeat protein
MIGKTISHFRLLERVAAGGMGVVYKARDEKLNRNVALKFVSESLSKDRVAIERFLREARAVSALNHPNVCTIYEVDEFEGSFFIALEFLDGESLEQYTSHHNLTAEEILDIGIQIAEGLSAAHGKGIIHRDIKPSNIFVTTGNIVKILDFGLSKLTSESPENVRFGSSDITVHGEMLTSATGVVGTLSYMSPEQARGDELDPRTDLFSLGAVIYEMASGQKAFAGDTPALILTAVMSARPPLIRSFDQNLPIQLERLIDKALQKTRALRYQSALELAGDLKRLKYDIGGGKLGPVNSPREKPPLAAASTIARVRKKTAIKSLAVLPFGNEIGDDPDAEYLSEGITDNIINSLSQFPGISVMARSIVFRYKNPTEPQKIGRELNVSAVLIGGVLQRGERLIVNAELVNVADGRQLWGTQYNTKFSEIFTIQEEISNRISSELRLHLSPQEKEKLHYYDTRDPVAYQLYLKGRHHWNKRTPDGVKKAIRFLQQAIDQDPGYALAYAGLADCFALFGGYRFLLPREAFPMARASAIKALEINSGVAEAHNSLAVTSLFYDWHWSQAEEEFKRAIHLSPRYATAHQWYTIFLAAMERPDEALASITRAHELDMLSLPINTHLGWAFYFFRRFDDAIKQLHATLELDPHYILAHYVLGQAFTQRGQYTEAIAELQMAASLSARLPPILSALGYAYGLAGEVDKAKQILAELAEASSKKYVSAYDLALVNLGLGQKDIAFELLYNAVQERCGWLIFLKIEPALDALRSDPRFPDLVQTVGLRLDSRLP